MNATIGSLAREGILQFGDGYRTKRSEHGAPGYRILRVADVLDDDVHLEGPDFVSEEFRANIGLKAAQAGDILLTTKGTVGRVAVMPATNDPVVYSPQLCYFRISRTDLLNPRFLRYWFSSMEFKRQAADRMNNTDMAAYINLADIRSLRLTLPSPDTQQAIAEVLGALDDKIAANTKFSETLLELTGARYEESLGASTIACTLDDVSTFHNRRRVPLSAQERDLRIGNIPYYGATGVFGFVDEFLFDEILLLVGEDGSVVNDDGSPVTQYIWGPSWVNNHAHVLTGKSITTELLYFAVRHTNVTSLVTGAVQPKISMGNLKRLELQIPGEDRRTQLEGELSNSMALYRSLSAENQTLAATRDALLPQLMSGKLRIKDAEALVAEAV